MDAYEFRPFSGQTDYPRMLAVLTANKAADGLDDADTLEGLIERYAQTSPDELAANMVMAESGGRLVGYGRMYTEKEVKAPIWHYNHRAFVLPSWQRRGLGTALLAWLEARAVAIAREQARARPAAARAGEAHWHQVICFEPEAGKAALLARSGYMPARHFYRMVRPDLNQIPDCPLPAGLEVRPVRAEYLRAVWEANVEAFSDHWGEPEHPESDYQGWLRNGEFQPEIWKVAWDMATDQVAGMVLGYIDHEQNKQQRRRRGWTENICVRRPWRRRGLARALIAASLRELKARGMTEAALGVDTENVSGALRVYESMGFRAVRKDTLWRKPLDKL
jgi:GNAT superfamily N-acetyltransferase